MQSQMRRSALSTAVNIVEGCARRTTREYATFINVATGSAAETQYLLDVSIRLGYVNVNDLRDTVKRFDDLVAQLKALGNSLQNQP